LERRGIGEERGLKRKRFEEGDINEKRSRRIFARNMEYLFSIPTSLSGEKMQQAGRSSPRMP